MSDSSTQSIEEHFRGVVLHCPMSNEYLSPHSVRLTFSFFFSHPAPKGSAHFPPGVSMTLKTWLVITQHNRVLDPF